MLKNIGAFIVAAEGPVLSWKATKQNLQYTFQLVVTKIADVNASSYMH